MAKLNEELDNLEDFFVNKKIEEEDIKNRLKKIKQAAVGKKSKRKGSRYEHDVATKIASYFGMKKDDCFIFPKNSPTVGQVEADLVPVKKMRDIWEEQGFGPLEAKNREEWTFNQFFSDDLIKNRIFKYWLDSNIKTKKNNSIVFFTKNHVVDLVFHRFEDAKFLCSYIKLHINGEYFIIQTLKSFLKANFIS